MKRVKNDFKISNRILYTLITLGILMLIATGIYAYGTSSPSTFGHSAGELNLDGVGNIVSSGYIHGSISGGNANLGSSTYEISGTNVAGQTVYAYGSMCVGNSAGDCSGSGGTVITSSAITVGSGGSAASQVFRGSGLASAPAGTSCLSRCPASWSGYKCLIAFEIGTTGQVAQFRTCDYTQKARDCWCVPS